MRCALVVLACLFVNACSNNSRPSDPGNIDASAQDAAAPEDATDSGTEDTDEDSGSVPPPPDAAPTDAAPIDAAQSDIDDGECEPGETRTYACRFGDTVEWCVCDAGGAWDCLPDPEVLCDGPCDDGSELVCEMEEPLCETGTWAAVRDGCWECINPATCGDGVAPCEDDNFCLGSQFCDTCYTSSCPDCDDCLGRCVSHGCPSEELVICNGLRPDCSDAQVSVVRDGCWVCVELSTCAPPRPLPEGGCTSNAQCGAAELCAPCPDGGDDCERACQASGCLSGDERDVTCYSERPVCEGEEVLIVRGGCWACESVLTCERAGEICEADVECPAGAYCGCPSGDCFVDTCIDTGCSPEPFVSCRAARPDCAADEVAIAVDGCWECVNRETCEPSQN